MQSRIGPEKIRLMTSKLPFTQTGSEDNYPFGLFAVPMSEIVRIHASSGTTGKSTVVGYTRNDISTWSEVMARTLTSAGANRNDFIQIAYGYGLFTGGLGLHYGGEKIGASVIPISTASAAPRISSLAAQARPS
jgi:phenylacetate-CoA ligase